MRAGHRFPTDELDPRAYHRALTALADQITHRLRRNDETASTLTITARYADQNTTTRSRTLPQPSHHGPTLITNGLGLLATLGLQRARVRTLTLPTTTPLQLSLDPADDRALHLEAAVDRVRARFGPTLAKPAVLASGARSRIPERT
ncbi:DinB/UmuC family translesion DNA polymerase [Streptomyces sp. NBC_00690]|uniref:DinB/UmuC family translesion DNA polymerase n=1 Tax=Streptomyces sp. NBC_00690 TaxID=2975808 RepID=UPI003FA7D46C